MEEEEYINSDNFKLPHVEICEQGEQIVVQIPVVLSAFQSS